MMSSQIKEHFLISVPEFPRVSFRLSPKKAGGVPKRSETARFWAGQETPIKEV